MIAFFDFLFLRMNQCFAHAQRQRVPGLTFIRSKYAMKILIPSIRLTLTALSICALSACGGGGGSTTTTVPGAPTIGAATAGSAQASVAFTAPTSNGGADISAYLASCVTGSSTAVTGTAATSPIVVTGLTNNSVYACSVTATNSAGTGAASSTVSATPVAGTTSVVTYSVPAPFVNAVEVAYTPTTALARDTAAMTTRTRYMISDASSASSASNYLSIGATYSSTTGYAVESGTVSSASTYSTYLSKLVQAVAATDGFFRLDSHLHPNDSIDADSTDTFKLKFRNNFGKAATTYGYVTFAYDTSTHLLQAKNRYTYAYNSTYVATYTLDSTFATTGAGYYVNYSSGVYKLVAAIGSATPLYLYSSPIDLGIPTFINPKGVGFVTQGPAPYLNKVPSTSSLETQIRTDVNATYSDQVSATGTDATTKTKADARLASIKIAVEGNSGGSLRYAPALYTAFRDGLLANKLVSDSISDGTPGQNLVPYVYFTNEADSSGTYHPFMVVINYGNQASPNGLKDIPSPPCLGACGTAVTRFSNLENYITMIPLRNYGQVTAVTENTFTKNLWIDVLGVSNYGPLDKNVYTYADAADNGLLIDGSVMFPAFNNTLVPSHLKGELSASGCHVGQGGGGPHCHADGYQSGQGLGLYNDTDYLSKTHPPLIGFGYDGVALFAQYRSSSDSTLLGYGTALDAFGGHNHDSIGYHYHAHTVVGYQPVGSTDTNDISTMHVLMKGAYIGKTNSIPNFRSSTNNKLISNIYMGGTVQPVP